MSTWENEGQYILATPCLLGSAQQCLGRSPQKHPEVHSNLHVETSPSLSNSLFNPFGSVLVFVNLFEVR